MNTKLLFALAAALVSLAVLAGCDIGVNPLIFDGTVSTGSIRVDEPTNTAFATSEVVNLQDVRNAISDEIDSVKFYNLTLLIDSTAGTAAGTTATGYLTINDGTSNIIAGLTNVPLSAFATERSIFDKKIPGWVYNASGVAHLLNLLKKSDAPTVTLAIYGTANHGPLHFTVHAKIYAQVFTKPKK